MRIPARVRERFFQHFVFVHINKTGGSSIERALGIPFEHRTALEKRDQLGERRFRSRYRFSFVRNPWDRVVSHYAYRVRTNQTGLGGDPIPFREWVRLAYAENDPAYYDKPRMFMPQLDWLTDGTERLLVDFVGRFERFHEDFSAVCRRLRTDASLPHLKSSQKGDYRSYYDDTSAEIVARCFARDIEYFGYRFEGPSEP